MSRDHFSRQYSIVAEARRRWSDAEKEAIIAEAARPGANISAVARRHGIKPSLLFRWRRMAREAQAHTTGAVFVPVALAAPSERADMSAPEAAPTMPPCPSAEAVPTDDRIEIELWNGRLVRVGSGADTGTLKGVLTVLDGR